MILALIGFVFCVPFWEASIVLTANLEEAELQALQASYKQNLEKLEATRQELGDQYRAGGDRKAILDNARQVLEQALNTQIFPAWYGTTWGFNGISETPGEGKIACGYFVTTCLRDAGLRLNRVKLAQQPSQRIIKSVTDGGAMKILYEKSMDEIAAYLEAQGRGIYIVGLDQHTGFVVHDGKKLVFVHSSYYRPPFSVTAEPIQGHNPLANSKYRVFGKILGDEMMRKWLLGETFELR